MPVPVVKQSSCIIGGIDTIAARATCKLDRDGMRSMYFFKFIVDEA